MNILFLDQTTALLRIMRNAKRELLS